MRKFFSVEKYPGRLDFALLFLRIVFGVAFAIHGWGKIQAPTSWMGPDSGTPAVFQFLAALSEFGGGIAIALGLVTRLAALGLISTMIVAVYTHAVKLGDPFVSATGGRSYELAAVFLAISVLFLAAGPGGLSLDRKIFGSGRS